MLFPDHFSDHAVDYAAHRPRYPQALFDHLATLVLRRECAWDCATGSGQAAVELAKVFSTVIATDASPQQIAAAAPHPCISYRVALAENSNLADASVDLVTVAQALHWFRFDEFYAEARRVARPGAILAAWTYDLHWVGHCIDGILRRFYEEIVGPYWPPERAYVEQGYRTIPFPFDEAPTPTFEIRVPGTVQQILDYMGTWSAVKRYEQVHGLDPRNLIRGHLIEAWGEGRREVHWPIYMRIGHLRPTR